MKYDFDTIIDRRNTQSEKWDVKDGELPMWVADMDFKSAPEIIKALSKRVNHGVFGYSTIPDEWYDAYRKWWRKRYSVDIKKEWLMFCTGVIPAISSVVRKLTTPGENVIIQTPVYNIFFNSILNNGRFVLENPLLYKDGEYSIDFDDLEKKMADPQSTLMLLCNPHNPVGKIWDKETLKRIGELAYRYNVTVVSDEIHCDITEPGLKYVPFAFVSDKCKKVCVTCITPTKSFNIAGIKTAAVYVPGENLRVKVRKAINTDEIAEPNAFACIAAISAYEKGEKWLDEMCEYVFENRRLAANFIKNNLPFVHLVDGKATYLLWLDLTSLGEKSADAAQFIRDNTGLYVCSGERYGKCGKGFVRINVACPRTVLFDGLNRLKNGIKMLKEKN